MKKNKIKKILTILLFFIIVVIESYFNLGTENEIGNTTNNNISYEISNIPEYNGQAYIEINNNEPMFTTEDMNLEEEYYSSLKGGKVRNGDGKN